MKKWKKAAAAAVIVAGVLSAGTSSMAAPAKPSKMFINGLYQQDVLVVNDRTMVQLRAFNDPKSFIYSYETATKTIIIENPVKKMTVHLKNGSKTAEVNGKNVKLDAPVTVKAGRTYIPVRFVTETLGGTVDYDNSAKYIIVRTPTGEEQFKTLKNGDLEKARELAIRITRVNNGTEIEPYGEGFSTTYTFPKGEALRYFISYKGLTTYVEINAKGIAEIKWQKDTLGKNGEAGKEPKPFGESVIFSDNFMADMVTYGTVDSAGKYTELGVINRYENKEYANVIIMPIEGEVRTDAK
ncbi:copper amine oxidase N-terminal domain-containing protein [Paenibacillus sp. PL91]|uniref:copper amine oxidase N-terminal domain-containing protein n=1 Tax=Paenibacillus sp. PL91 TaxID=2729538 RepID=UPI00145EB6FC|nr:copper amine oxidase N-terminal domain-containing protein [Paenibacillus sp. PL91]MBC9203078.1 copper amine oxidase N-terminal domain-containing protein [Paenibacillus sp. PL91]